MKTRIQKISFILSIIFVFALIAGCTSESGTSTATPSVSVTTAPQAEAMYSAGDIVKNPKISSQYALLIIGYDPSTDMYERALIYPNSDGTWGYRINSNSEKISRIELEKVYTQKITHVTVSAIPVSAPTPVVTVATASATTAASVTTTTTALAPQIRSIDPDNALAGTTVTISDLEGYNFQTGATVALTRTGSNNISATNVNVVSSSQIYCNFVIPSSAAIGIWGIIVTNPDGQSAIYQNGFTVHENPNAGTTTSTTTTVTTAASSSTTITMVDPPVITAGGAGTYVVMKVYGSNIPSNSNIVLKQSGKIDMVGSSAYMPTTGMLQASFNILPNTVSSGSWTVAIVDSSGNVLATLPNGVSIS